jgi:hypothetical protein
MLPRCSCAASSYALSDARSGSLAFMQQLDELLAALRRTVLQAWQPLLTEKLLKEYHVLRPSEEPGHPLSLARLQLPPAASQQKRAPMPNTSSSTAGTGNSAISEWKASAYRHAAKDDGGSRPSRQGRSLAGSKHTIVSRIVRFAGIGGPGHNSWPSQQSGNVQPALADCSVSKRPRTQQGYRSIAGPTADPGHYNLTGLDATKSNCISQDQLFMAARRQAASITDQQHQAQVGLSGFVASAADRKLDIQTGQYMPAGLRSLASSAQPSMVAAGMTGAGLTVPHNSPGTQLRHNLQSAQRADMILPAHEHQYPPDSVRNLVAWHKQPTFHR